MNQPTKFGGIIQISNEIRWLSSNNPDYQRRVRNITTTPVTQEQETAHAKAVEALAHLTSYEGYNNGNPDYEPEIEPLRPAREIDYAETWEEWADRCRELDARAA
jgi:hypothetical protein